MSNNTFSTQLQWTKVQQDKFRNQILDNAQFQPPPGVDELSVLKTAIVTALTFIPYGPVISGITDVFLTFLIETYNEDKSILRYQQICREMIANSLYQYDDNQIKALFRACSIGMRDYNQHWRELKADPTNEALKEVMRVNFQNLENEIATKYLYQCKKPGFEEQELVFFSMFATNHLIVLRDCIYSGVKEWGMHANSVKLYSDKFYQLIDDYAQYCKKTYNSGLKTIKDQRDACYRNKWNRINRWRSYHIMCVFDFVNLWFAMDPRVNDQSIIYTPVRYLFSDIMGTPYNATDDNHVMNPEDIDNTISANNYNLYQNELKKVQYSLESYRMRSFQPFFHSENSTNGYRSGQLISGTRNDLNNPIATIDFDITKSYNKASIKNGYFMMNCTIKSPNDTNKTINAFDWSNFQFFCSRFMVECELRWRSPGTWDDPTAPGKNFENVELGFDGHKIGNIFALTVNDYRDFTNKNRFLGGACDCFIFAWQPEQLFHQNILPKANRILIDAQKYTTYSYASFNYDYFYPGVHAMTIPPSSYIQFKLLPEDESQTIYEVKLRCNVKSKTTLKVLNVTVAGSTEQVFTIPAAVNKNLATSSTGQFKIDIGKTGSTYQFSTTDVEIVLQSLLFIPVPPAK